MKKQVKTNLQSGSALLAVTLAIILANGCNSPASDSQSKAPADGDAKSADEIIPPTNPSGFIGAIGNVVKYSDNLVEITANDKPLLIKLTDSLRIYAPSPSSLANVKSSEYVGVISEKQALEAVRAARVFLCMPMY